MERDVRSSPKYLEDTLWDIAAVRSQSEVIKRNASFIGRNYLKGSSRFARNHVSVF